MTHTRPRWLLALVFCLCGGAVLAQDLRVVTVTRTPFSQVENGEDTGFTLDLWAEIARQLGQSYTVERVDSFPEMLGRIEEGSADIAAANILCERGAHVRQYVALGGRGEVFVWLAHRFGLGSGKARL